MKQDLYKLLQAALKLIQTNPRRALYALRCVRRSALHRRETDIAFACLDGIMIVAGAIGDNGLRERVARARTRERPSRSTFLSLGHHLRSTGRLAAARNAYRHALLLSDGSGLEHDELIERLSNTALLERTHSPPPSDVESTSARAHIDLAIAYAQMNMLVDARRALDAALAYEPDNARALYWRRRLSNADSESSP